MRATPLSIDDRERQLLQLRLRDRSVPSEMVDRLRIVLLAADGWLNVEIASQLGVSIATVAKWRDRFAAEGAAGLVDKPRSGRPRRVDRAGIIRATLRPPPPESGLDRWSCRELAVRLGLGDATIGRAWREFGLTPQSQGRFMFSVQPPLVTSTVEIVGVYHVGDVRLVALVADAAGDPGRAPSPVTPMQPVWRPAWVRAAEDDGHLGTTRDASEVTSASGIGDYLRELTELRPGERLHLVADSADVARAAHFAADSVSGSNACVHVTVDTRMWLNLVDVWEWLMVRDARVADDHPAARVRQVHETGQWFVWLAPAGESDPSEDRSDPEAGRDLRSA